MQPCLLQASLMSSQNFRKSVHQTGINGGFRGGSRGSHEPPSKLKYLIFMVNFKKNQETLINDLIKLTNGTPLCKFEPPIKTS